VAAAARAAALWAAVKAEVVMGEEAVAATAVDSALAVAAAGDQVAGAMALEAAVRAMAAVERARAEE